MQLLEPDYPTTLTQIQQQIQNELLEIQELEKLNPVDKETSEKSFISNFDRTDTTLTHEEQHYLKKFSINFTIFLPEIFKTLLEQKSNGKILHQDTSQTQEPQQVPVQFYCQYN